jgi:hypothetical protein
MVLSVSARSILIDNNSTLLIGALPKDILNGYAIDILVAQNPHFHDNWQIGGCPRLRIPAHAIGFDYALG